MSILRLFDNLLWSFINPKATAIVACFSATLILVSCNNNSSEKGKKLPDSVLNKSDSLARTQNLKGKKQPKLLNNMISAFYLEASIVKTKLLDNGNGNGKKAKFILQFTHEANNTTGLIAWPGEKAHKSFDLGSETQLKPTVAVSGIDISGKALILGDLQLGKNEAKALFATLDKGTYKFIVFTPDILVDASKHYKHLYYKIGGTNDDPGKQELLLSVDSITVTNPSPPRGADEDL